MTRIVKKHDVRKNEILDAARKFFFQKGYEKTTIQDIIDELGIAKGTFYHYFKSKIDLLNSLTDRTTNEISASLKPIVDSDTNAIDKFNRLFREAAAIKMSRIDVLTVILKVIFKDENIIIREKMYTGILKKNVQMFSKIINQGVQEGLFKTPYPDEAAEMMLQIGKTLNAEISKLLLRKDETLEHLLKLIKKKTRMYEYTVEKILGAPKGSFKVYIPEDFEGMVRFIKKNLKQKNNDV